VFGKPGSYSSGGGLNIVEAQCDVRENQIWQVAVTSGVGREYFPHIAKTIFEDLALNAEHRLDSNLEWRSGSEKNIDTRRWFPDPRRSCHLLLPHRSDPVMVIVLGDFRNYSG
jgi:hypothetical protein